MKIYKPGIRPVMIHGAETRVLKKRGSWNLERKYRDENAEEDNRYTSLRGLLRNNEAVRGRVTRVAVW